MYVITSFINSMILYNVSVNAENIQTIVIPNNVNWLVINRYINPAQKVIHKLQSKGFMRNSVVLILPFVNKLLIANFKESINPE